jgi:hypothetical protein
MPDFRQQKNPLSRSFMSDREWRALPQAERNAYLSVTAKYGENRWWLSSDPVEIARHQVDEAMILAPLGMFREGIKRLIGRYASEEEMIVGALDDAVRQAARRLDANRAQGSAADKKQETQPRRAVVFDVEGSRALDMPAAQEPVLSDMELKLREMKRNARFN